MVVFSEPLAGLATPADASVLLFELPPGEPAMSPLSVGIPRWESVLFSVLVWLPLCTGPIGAWTVLECVVVLVVLLDVDVEPAEPVVLLLLDWLSFPVFVLVVVSSLFPAVRVLLLLFPVPEFAWWCPEEVFVVVCWLLLVCCTRPLPVLLVVSC